MQICPRKPTSGWAEKNQGTRVVLDVTEGLRGHNVTCDSFFISYELGQCLLRKITMVGQVCKNKPELPPALLASKERDRSSQQSFPSGPPPLYFLTSQRKARMQFSWVYCTQMVTSIGISVWQHLSDIDLIHAFWYLTSIDWYFAVNNKVKMKNSKWNKQWLKQHLVQVVIFSFLIDCDTKWWIINCWRLYLWTWQNWSDMSLEEKSVGKPAACEPSLDLRLTVTSFIKSA